MSRFPLSRRRAHFVASAAFGLFAAGAAFAEPKVLAKIDGVAITDQDVADALMDIGPGLPEKLEGPARNKYVLDYLIDMRIVAKEAAARKSDDDADFKRRLTYFHDKLAMEFLLTDVGKKSQTEENEHKAYDEAAKENPPQPEAHARHILVPTEDEAKAAIERLKKGEDFAKLATELSKDPGSEGGDLGWFTKDKMVPEFSEAAFKLEAGGLSGPVKSQFGWHVIKLEEKRMKEFPPFDAVKDQAARFVMQKAQSELIGQLHKAVKVERFDEPPAKGEAPKQ